MEGSIADSTVLRVRAQLQCIHHASANNQADGFLEELLKLPAAPITTPEDDERPSDPAPDPLSTSNSTDRTANSKDKSTQVSDEEPPADDDSLAPQVPMCYAPPVVPVPAPEVNGEVVSAEATVDAVASTIDSTQVVESSKGTDQADVDARSVASDAEVNSVAEAVPITDRVEPVASSNIATAKENNAKNLRDVRRGKESQVKPDANAQPGQSIDSKLDIHSESRSQSASQTSAQSIDDKVPSNEQSLATDTSSQVTQVSSAVENKGSGDNDRADRDKWYENKESVNGQDPSTDLVDQLRESNTDRSQDPWGDKSASLHEEPSAAQIDNNLIASDASTSIAADSSQQASDLALAVQSSMASSAGGESIGTARTGASAGNERSAEVTSAGRSASSSASANSSAGSNTIRSSATPGTSASTTSTGSTNSADSADKPRELTQQERVRLVQRVARSFSRLGPDGGQVSLKLHPPQLGVLNVTIKMEGQTMTARLQTETSSARDTIIENLPVLRDRLSEQGIEIEKFQVEVGQQENLSSGSGQAGGGFTGSGDSQQSETARTAEFDYRRASRSAASRQSVGMPGIVEPNLQRWTAADRTLDVKA